MRSLWGGCGVRAEARKRVTELNPGLRPALLALVEPDVRGDPMSPLRWTVQSTRTLARELNGAGHRVRDDTRQHRDTGQPVISVDTKKKELVGEFKNNGRQWQPTGEPVPVNVHDFADPHLGKAVPYGIYDVAANTGWINVGTDHDTAAFAVESIRRWWHGQGQAAYPQAARLFANQRPQLLACGDLPEGDLS